MALLTEFNGTATIGSIPTQNSRFKPNIRRMKSGRKYVGEEVSSSGTLPSNVVHYSVSFFICTLLGSNAQSRATPA